MCVWRGAFKKVVGFCHKLIVADIVTGLLAHYFFRILDILWQTRVSALLLGSSVANRYDAADGSRRWWFEHDRKKKGVVALCLGRVSRKLNRGTGVVMHKT